MIWKCHQCIQMLRKCQQCIQVPNNLKDIRLELNIAIHFIADSTLYRENLYKFRTVNNSLQYVCQTWLVEQHGQYFDVALKIAFFSWFLVVKLPTFEIAKVGTSMYWTEHQINMVLEGKPPDIKISRYFPL